MSKREQLFVPDPGEYENIPFADYLAWNLPSQSIFKCAAESPLHMKEARDGAPLVPTDPMILGTAMHVAFLEPDQMASRVVCWRNGARRGSDWAAFCEEHAGKAILTEGFYEQLSGMVRALRKHPVVRNAVSRIERTELSVVGDVFGTVCKGRIDGDGPDIIADLKTCKSANKRAFAQSAVSLGYDIQAAMYTQLRPGREFIIIAVENQPPHDVAAFRFDSSFLQDATDRLAVYVQMYQECERTVLWPGRCDGLQTLEMPEWMAAQAADEITIDGELAYGAA